jgi:hypothetical protein
VGNGKSMTATKVGSLKCFIIQVDGSGLEITLHEVKYVPELRVNLFSINKAFKKGYKLSNKGLSNGSVSGIKLSINESPVAYNTISNFRPGKSININDFHKMLGHCGSDRLQKTAKIHGLKLSGKFETCAECAIAKARQKNVNK